MKEKINCPLCRRRAFDIDSSVKGDVLVELKCPHCRNIIKVKHRIYGIRNEELKHELTAHL